MAPFDKEQVRQSQLDLWTSNVNILRKEGTFTDVVIVCGDKEVHAHRVVLSAGSPFFSAMLQTSMTEASTGRIQLHTLDPDAVEIVVNFIYSGEILSIEGDVTLARAVLEAAHMMQIMALFEYALQVLRGKLSSSYFVDLLEIADLYDVPRLQDQVYVQVAYQLEEACRTDDFQRLSANHIQKIVGHPILDATTLDIVVDAVFEWARDTNARHPVLIEILKTLDLTLLSADFINRLLYSEVIAKQDDLLLTRLQESATQYTGWAPYQSSHPTSSNLICYGKSRSHESLFSIYDNKTNCFRAPVPIVSSLPEDASTVAYKGIIYFIGGYNETGMSKAVLRFYPLVKTVVNFSNLLHEVSDAGVVCFLGKIYIVGGFDIYKRHSRRVQCLDTVSGICTEVASTSKLHRYPLVGHVAEHIYVVGTKLNDQFIERYHPTINEWTVVSAIPNPVCGSGVTFGKRVIYCVPNCNKPQEMWSCNPSALVWQKHSLKNSPMSFQGRWTVWVHGTEEFSLFVTDEQECMYCYIPGSDKWIQLSMTEPTSSRNSPPSMMCVLGFCVV